MLEPVGAKQEFWHMGETLQCPSEKYPFIFTNKNSAQAVKDFQPSTTQVSLPTSTSPISTTTAVDVTTSSADETSTKRHKHHKSDSDDIDSYQFAATAGLFFLIFILLIIAITRRQQIRVFIQGTSQRHLNSFVNPPYADDAQEDDIWSRSSKGNHAGKHILPHTHGTRINFE